MKTYLTLLKENTDLSENEYNTLIYSDKKDNKQIKNNLTFSSGRCDIFLKKLQEKGYLEVDKCPTKLKNIYKNVYRLSLKAKKVLGINTEDVGITGKF